MRQDLHNLQNEKAKNPVHSVNPLKNQMDEVGA